MDLSLLTLLFGQLGALGTICVVGAGSFWYLLKQEQKAHDDTRKIVYQQFNRLAESQQAVATVLAELKLLLTGDDEDEGSRGGKGRR